MEDLILLHGALGTPDYFDFLEKNLYEGFNIFKPKLSGHAGAAMLSTQISMQGYVDELADFISKKKLNKVHIFGYSMGGYIALKYASNYPEKVKSIMTLATKWNWDEAVAERESAMLDPDKIKSKVPQFAQYLAHIHGQEHWENLTRQIAKMLLNLGRDPLLDKETLTALKVPILLASGDKDNMIKIEETIYTAQKIPNADIAILPNTLHPFERINRPLLLQILGDFLKKNVAN